MTFLELIEKCLEVMVPKPVRYYTIGGHTVVFLNEGIVSMKITVPSNLTELTGQGIINEVQKEWPKRVRPRTVGGEVGS